VLTFIALKISFPAITDNWTRGAASRHTTVKSSTISAVFVNFACLPRDFTCNSYILYLIWFTLFTVFTREINYCFQRVL